MTETERPGKYHHHHRGHGLLTIDVLSVFRFWTVYSCTPPWHRDVRSRHYRYYGVRVLEGDGPTIVIRSDITNTSSTPRLLPSYPNVSQFSSRSHSHPGSRGSVDSVKDFVPVPVTLEPGLTLDRVIPLPRSPFRVTSVSRVQTTHPWTSHRYRNPSPTYTTTLFTFEKRVSPSCQRCRTHRPYTTAHREIPQGVFNSDKQWSYRFLRTQKTSRPAPLGVPKRGATTMSNGGRTKKHGSSEEDPYDRVVSRKDTLIRGKTKTNKQTNVVIQRRPGNYSTTQDTPKTNTYKTKHLSTDTN